MRGSARFYAQYAFGDKNHGNRKILLAALDGRRLFVFSVTSVFSVVNAFRDGY